MKVLVTGGARSGKSRHAQALAESLATRRVFVATAEALDDEMRDRIARHRSHRGADWRTIEEPLDVAPRLQAGEVVLVDCLTLWISNLMIRRGTTTPLDVEFAKLIDALEQARNHVVMVTNEVGLGIVPDNALSRTFRDHAGHLAQRVAAICDQVILMCAGMPLRVK